MTGSPVTYATGTRLPGHPDAWTGRGIAGWLPHTLARLSARRVLVVHGGTSYERCGAQALVDAATSGRQVVHLAAVRPNPDVAQVAAGVRTARRFRPDLVLGIGGGSSLDVAKCVALLAAQPDSAEDCLRDRELVRHPRACHVVLVPTTAGSGSELTRFATVYRDGHKLSLDRDPMRADVALVDPQLSATLPTGESVAGGLDALSHAVESYWSVAATQASRALAWQALSLLVPALVEAVDAANFDEPGLRAAMAHGAALAGAAIDTTRTTAAHALSYALTARLGLPHGVAVALHLRWLADKHARLEESACRHPDGAEAVRRRTARVDRLVADYGGDCVPALVARLLTLAGQPAALAELALPAQSWMHIFTAALASERASNNPARLTEADLRPLLV